MIRQVSIFAPNMKGSMHKVTTCLRKAGVNIMALITNDSGEFGLVRMIVDDTDKAAEALEAAGYMVRISPVIGAEISDDVGGLDDLLADLESINISADYIYISYLRDARNVVAIIHAHNQYEIESSLRSKGWTIL